MSSSDPQGLQAFPDELSEREAWLEPFDWYREMRERAPVRYDPTRKVWDVFRYDDVKEMLDDDERFSVSPRNASGFQEPEGEEAGVMLDTMLLQDPPRHDELRGVVDEEFSPRTIRELEPRIRELTTELLDDILDNGDEIDLVSEFAYPLPVIVIAELLGVPTEDREQFKTWSDAIVSAASEDESGAEFVERQEEMRQEMAFYFIQLMEDRRENPQDDLISTLVTAEIDGEPLTHREILGTCILLLVAGNITTTNLITNAMRSFDEVDAVDELAGDDRALTTAIEEVLRYRSPVQAMTRVAMEDVTMHGETIEEGDQIVVWLGSGNRDERQFDDADEFRPDRTPNQHFGFGYGTHYCLGAPLARLEAKVALSELLSRVSNVTIPETTLEPTRSSFIYGVESLPIRFDRE
ncbi:cytochrome P450 [Haladaptatus paucihalophilus DX253]|uniref:Cytochrome P450 n=1 Tax=Haladaptatus paucihalophilus DX253 TaxID=797209 RepID=E7QSM9_HALPU|nr:MULTISPECIES: cytochrome P450 [Haladaptatus]EFW92438.1 cytochrome P450 [Haladaptatus paucihalophilus DX253]GKZ13395.1 putative cytochrome P450 YjiB [Haladaptatus sp. T7]SHK06157.1 Cytochrome P450 [Haladaptatus paucihalophilus DX253]